MMIGRDMPSLPHTSVAKMAACVRRAEGFSSEAARFVSAVAAPFSLTYVVPDEARVVADVGRFVARLNQARTRLQTERLEGFLKRRDGP